MLILRALLTLAAAAGGGLLLRRLRLPGGMLIGALFASAALMLLTGLAYMPRAAAFIAKTGSGMYIACSITRDDLKRLRYVVKPCVILLSGYMVLNAVMGAAISAVSGMDMLTAMFCAVPGGVNEAPLIADSYGADITTVAVMQLVRMVYGIAVMPQLIQKFTPEPEERVAPAAAEPGMDCCPAAEPQPCREDEEPAGRLNLLLTLLVAAASGGLGYYSGVPAGELLFALVGVLTFKLLTGRAVCTGSVKLCAQTLSGSYMGQAFTVTQLIMLKTLLLPTLILLAGYTVFCVLMASLLNRTSRISRREACLSATPAGASDMMLISSDLGVHSPNLVVLQVVRVVAAVSLFPQFALLMAKLLG